MVDTGTIIITIGVLSVIGNTLNVYNDLGTITLVEAREKIFSAYFSQQISEETPTR